MSNGGPHSDLLSQILSIIDARLRATVEKQLDTDGPSIVVPTNQTIVLAGHRAAGKSRLLPLVARLLGRRGLDLDAEIERCCGRSLAQWVACDEPSFRAAERQVFDARGPGLLVAVGGGFLAHHGDALGRCTTVLVPISQETYRERLLADSARPRLRPDLSLTEEIETTYKLREASHTLIPSVALAALLRPYARARFSRT